MRNCDNPKLIEVDHLHSHCRHSSVIAESTKPDRQVFNTTLAETLTKSIQTMLTHTSSERGRIAVPLITNATGISPFPIRMTVRVDGVEIGGI